jgi:hypothetical protein
MSRYGIVLSEAWPGYYASSPFNTLRTACHDSFEVIETSQHKLAVNENDLHYRINAFEAVVVDDVCAPYLGFYKGPKLMIGGDPHAHTRQQVERLEREYAAVDYVLTGAVFSKKLPQYHYPSEETRRKHVYFPHMVPDVGPVGQAWSEREELPLIPGSTQEEVYPFRHRVRRRPGEVRVTPGVLPKLEYFNWLGRSRAAVTCNSIFEYTVAKYFEIPWMGAVLMAPPISAAEAEIVGFKDRTNVIWLDRPEDIVSATYYVNHNDYAIEIAHNGQQLMESRHSTHARLNYLEELINSIYSTSFKPEDALQIFKDHSHVSKLRTQ